MPPKKKQWFLSLRDEEKAIQDFIENIADIKEAPFDNNVLFEGSDVDDEIPALIPESELVGE